VLGLESAIEWLKAEVRKKATLKTYGEITLSLRITEGQITDIRKTSEEVERYPVKRG